MKYIGFGAGNIIGETNQEFLRGLSYLVDNDKSKQGLSIDELNVFSPYVLLNEEKENTLIIVLSKLFYTEISKQLREMGFVEGRHFIKAFGWYGNDEISAPFGKNPDIILSAPKVVQTGGRSRLVCEILEDDEQKELWIEVDNEYAKYFCFERSDAFLIGLLPYAMRQGKDIKCMAPVTEELCYNIETVLIPAMVENCDQRLHNTKIYTEMTSESLICEGGVGTGLSCGVDSFHAVLNFVNSKYKSMKLTHLCINNTGAFYKGYSDAGVDYVRRDTYNKARNVAKELGIPLIETDSNIQYGFPVTDFNITATFATMFVVFSLQKLWRIFFYASTYKCSLFSMKDNDINDNAFFDLLTFNCFSRADIKIYSEGAEKTRLEKLRAIADYDIVQNNLKVCRVQAINCCVCDKCRQTLLDIDAIGKLEKFSSVFDIDYYKDNRDEYLEWLCTKKQWDDCFRVETYEYLIQDPDMAQMLGEIERKLSHTALLYRQQSLTHDKKMWQSYAGIFEYLATDENAADTIFSFLASRGFHKIAFYGESSVTLAICSLLKSRDIEIAYIVEDFESKLNIPSYPRNTVDYPLADAIIISDLNHIEMLKNKVRHRVSFPVLTVYDLIKLL